MVEKITLQVFYRYIDKIESACLKGNVNTILSNTRITEFIAQHLYNKNMFPLASKTAGPNGLKFFVDTHG